MVGGAANVYGISFILNKWSTPPALLPPAAKPAAVAGAAGAMDESEEIRVRFHIIRNARIEYVGTYQSCMVSKVRIVWKQTVAARDGCAEPGCRK